MISESPWTPSLKGNLLQPYLPLAILDDDCIMLSSAIEDSQGWSCSVVWPLLGKWPGLQKSWWEAVVALWRLRQIGKKPVKDGVEWERHVAAWMVRQITCDSRAPVIDEGRQHCYYLICEEVKTSPVKVVDDYCLHLHNNGSLSISDLPSFSQYFDVEYPAEDDSNMAEGTSEEEDVLMLEVEASRLVSKKKAIWKGKTKATVVQTLTVKTMKATKMT